MFDRSRWRYSSLPIKICNLYSIRCRLPLFTVTWRVICAISGSILRIILSRLHRKTRISTWKLSWSKRMISMREINLLLQRSNANGKINCKTKHKSHALYQGHGRLASRLWTDPDQTLIGSLYHAHTLRVNKFFMSYVGRQLRWSWYMDQVTKQTG